MARGSRRTGAPALHAPIWKRPATDVHRDSVCGDRWVVGESSLCVRRGGASVGLGYRPVYARRADGVLSVLDGVSRVTGRRGSQRGAVQKSLPKSEGAADGDLSDCGGTVRIKMEAPAAGWGVCVCPCLP